MSRIICCVVFASLFILSAHVEAAVLCAKKAKTGDASGAVFIREVCKASEKPLDPVTVGLQTIGPAVYDANGEKVGEAVSISLSGATVALTYSDHFFLLNVEANRLLGNSGDDVIFETTDCSGTPFIGGDRAGSAPRVVVSEPNDTAYVAGPQTPVQNIVPRSSLTRGDSNCHTFTSETVSLVPASAVVSLGALFTPPFHIGKQP